LKFNLGNDPWYRAPQGYFTAVQNGVNEGIYQEGQAKVEAYMNKQKKTPSMKPPGATTLIRDEYSMNLN